VGVGDLAAQRQAYTRSAGLGGEKRDEQIRRAREPRPFVIDPDLYIFSIFRQPICTPPPVSSAASAALRNRLISSWSS